MKRLVNGHGLTAMATALVVVLAAGGGYAVARAGGGNKIKACATKHSHILYTGKCKKGDKKLSWSKVGPKGATGPRGATGGAGPQGPGAKKLVYDATGSSASPGTSLGTMGPYSLSGQCLADGAGSTTTNIFISGPGGALDGMSINTDTPSGASGTFPALSNAPLFGGVQSTAASTSLNADQTDSAQVVFLPSSGESVEALITIAATGGTTAPSGGMANKCHASIVVTPVS